MVSSSVNPSGNKAPTDVSSRVRISDILSVSARSMMAGVFSFLSLEGEEDQKKKKKKKKKRKKIHTPDVISGR